MAERFGFDLRLTSELRYGSKKRRMMDARAFELVAQGFFMTSERLAEFAETVLPKIVSDVFIPEIAANFEAEGRPPWPPLADETVANRERLGFSGAHPILEMSGDMKRAAIAQESWKGAFGGRTGTMELDPAAMPPYAFFHRTGTDFMPVRDWLSFEGEDIDSKIENLMADFVLEAVDDGLGSVV